MRKTILALGLAASLSAFSLTASAANAQNTTDYIMCPGDVLQVVVYGHEDLSTPMTAGATNSPYVVRPDGKVSFPLIGDVDVTGKTVAQFREELANRFSQYLVTPSISVNVMKLGTTRVYVLGEIKRPGLYELEKSHKVIDALAKAEGFTEKAAKKNVFLVRAGSTEVQKLNVNNYLTKADQKANVVLNEGDCLYLTSNHKVVFSKDIMPFLSAAYYVSEIKNDND